MTSPFPTEAPELIGVGAEAIVERSKHLGLVWTRRLATVISADDPPNSTVMFDGDSVEAAAVSMLGILPAGTRVYVDIIPPGGNFIIGLFTGAFNAFPFVPQSVNAALGAGTTTSASYANLTGSVAVTLDKIYTTTRIRIDLHVTSFSTLANTEARFAANIAGVGDGDICQLFFNPANTHSQASGTAILPANVAGSIVITGRWRRVAGGGTLTTNTDDWFSMTAAEVP